MKVRYLIGYVLLLICLAITGAVWIWNSNQNAKDYTLDGVTVNRLLGDLSDNWEQLSKSQKQQIDAAYQLNYTVIDMSDNVLAYTKEGISTNLAEASMHCDLIRDIYVNDVIVGKVIIYNESAKAIRLEGRKLAGVFLIFSLVNILVIIVYSVFIYRNVIKPFQKMNGFASSVAAGNLDITLERDRYNMFGVFTESFDIMREQLHLSRQREAEAKMRQKELVAQLSHDIKTPVASIKAMSEVMLLTAASENNQATLNSIIEKTDQIDDLVSNLFHATLEELEQLSVNVEDLSSVEVKRCIEESDYLKNIVSIELPDCIIRGDRLRVQQVFGNVIINSYKYANTEIVVEGRIEQNLLLIDVKDYGPGVATDDIPLLTQKFKRGANAKDVKGAGLGLYIANYLCEKMEGIFTCGNWENGFIVTIGLKLS